MQQTRLMRSETDKMIAGVCGGLADYVGIDPVLVRLAFVFLLWPAASGSPFTSFYGSLCPLRRVANRRYASCPRMSSRTRLLTRRGLARRPLSACCSYCLRVFPVEPNGECAGLYLAHYPDRRRRVLSGTARSRLSRRPQGRRGGWVRAGEISPALTQPFSLFGYGLFFRPPAGRAAAFPASREGGSRFVS